jgi:hypothetical protein
VVAPPAGVRLRVSGVDAAVLREVGGYLGSLSGSPQPPGPVHHMDQASQDGKWARSRCPAPPGEIFSSPGRAVHLIVRP